MSLEQTIGNLEIRYANVVTFVGSSNTMVDTTTGRIQTKGIQHNSNVITDVSGPHGRVAPTLKKYPEIAFESGKFDSNDSTNTYVQAGYTVTSSTTYSTHGVYKVFNGVPNDFFSWEFASFANSDGTYSGGTQSFESIPGEWLKIEVPNKIKPASINLYRRDFDGQSPKDFKIYASITGSSWTLLTEQTGIDNWTNAAKSYNFDTGIYYKYFAILVTKITRTNSAGAQTSGTLGELELYGTEENPPAGDHSVDTTFKSRFNNPQLTGVQVLVDGATGVGTNHISGGPDVTGTTTYNESGKHWELNGQLTSNITMEANTFLEGDQPHAVSVWFNSSNLEANVSNTCVFSIASEEKLDSVNLDLQSNTWHNLTYAYQGEGGSRVTYLDGRKVAEDQAEDTFGEYPPFAMTGYSQGGYVVSASSEFDANYQAWEAFNGIYDPNGDAWMCENNNALYPSADNYVYDGSRQLASNTPLGEWLKIKLPYKFVLSHIRIVARDGQGARAPEDFKIFGSIDNVIWSEILSETGAVPSEHDATPTYYYADTTTNAYKYFAMIITRTVSFTIAGLAEWELYGHRENDLVRLPDPTNVLKYPHIAMTGPAQRGYVASASSFNTTSGTNGYPPWEAFDDKYTDVNSTHGTMRWQPPTTSPARYTDPGNGPWTPTTSLTDNITTLASGSSPASYTGDWLQLESPNKLNIKSYRVYNSTNYVTDHNAHTVVLLGSNTGIDDWVDIGSGETVLSWDHSVDPGSNYVSTVAIASTSGNTGFYKYHRLIVRKVTDQHIPVIYQLQLFGTEEASSVPIQIGGGNIDKVANFRVYDKFIGEDQVNEIWNAQKEEFGRAKPQMVLQQGKLGIGTDTPQGSLSVADEPHNLEEFPPRAMTGYKNYFEGHGEFCASASSWYNQHSSTDPVYPWNAFNKGALGFSTGNGHGNNWEPSAPGNYNTTTGLFEGSGSNLETSGIGGDWVQLELPYAITLDHMKFMPAYYNDGSHIPLGAARSPKDGHIMASDDGLNWISIYNWVSRTDFTQLEYTTFKVPETVTKAYKYFRVVWTRTNSTAPSAGSYDTYASAGEIKFFGTREQGQSVLHDGRLTLTKSLNVPRIGPPLDADDTPRRDRLVVEYNTSTNPTFEGAVRDTSGRGNDIIMHGNAKYDANEKAFRLDGTNGTYMSGTQTLGTGTPVHTITGWFKQVVSLNNWTYVMFIGTSASGQMAGMLISNTGQIVFDIYNTRIDTTVDASTGIWHHFAGVFKGGTSVWDNASTDLYINGQLEGSAAPDSGTQYSFNLTGNGIQFGSSTNFVRYFNGFISNFKLYDTALTAEEVKTLYDMGRNGSVANPQPLHIAAPLYAPGTIAQAQYASTPLNNTVRQTITGGELSDAANDVDYLDMNFKPKFANSSILLTAMINTSSTHVASFGFKEDGTLVRTQADNTNSTGGISTFYGGTSYENRMRNINIQVMVPANGTHTRRYNVAANSYWSNTNYNLYINDRNTNNSMSSISNMVVYEIVN